jgi:uncharacterized membrane protein YidH (DUF202 family)
MNLFLPNIAYADGVDDFIAKVDSNIINPLISFLFALAVLFFLYGVLQFFLNRTNEEKRTSAKEHMIWGVIGMTIMMGVFAILNMVLSTLNIQGIDVKKGTVNSTEWQK